MTTSSLRRFLVGSTLAILVALATLSCTRSYTLPAVEDVVMYQVNPRNYAPQDSFKEISRHLDEIEDLGVNVIWFMPICEIGVEKSVKSPYCVRNYVSVNPEFGTVEDFKELVSGAHKRGMSVIIDWVANHTAWDHAWIKDHPDWYTRGEDGEIISPAGTGWRDVADLDFDNPGLCREMISQMRFWVDEVGIDGFRCDAADFVPYEFWVDCVRELRSTSGHPLLLLAEGQRKDHFEAGFDMNYAWGWLSALRRLFSTQGGGFGAPPAGNSEGRRMQRRGPTPVSTLFEADSQEYEGLSEGKVKLRFTTNHDEYVKNSPVREFWGNDGSVAAFVASTFIHGGMLVYGCQEVGYPGKINFFNYVPVDWKANPEMRASYKKLISIFKNEPAIRKGSMTPHPDNDILVFERTLGKDTILVMVNLRDEQKKVAVPSSFVGKTAMELSKEKPVTLSSDITLAPFQYMILK